jgi:hypothetical protein
MAGSSQEAAIEMTDVPEQAPSRRGFFDRVKDVVGDEAFERDFALAAVERDCRVNLFIGGQGTTNHHSHTWVSSDSLSDPISLKRTINSSESRHAVLLVEDAGRAWFELLDAAYSLIPAFVSSYARGEESGPFVMGESASLKDWCVFVGESNVRPSDCKDLDESDGPSYWRQRMRQTPDNRLRSVTGCCYLGLYTCARSLNLVELLGSF